MSRRTYEAAWGPQGGPRAREGASSSCYAEIIDVEDLGGPPRTSPQGPTLPVKRRGDGSAASGGATRGPTGGSESSFRFAHEAPQGMPSSVSSFSNGANSYFASSEWGRKRFAGSSYTGPSGGPPKGSSRGGPFSVVPPATALELQLGVEVWGGPEERLGYLYNLAPITVQIDSSKEKTESFSGKPQKP